DALQPPGAAAAVALAHGGSGVRRSHRERAAGVPDVLRRSLSNRCLAAHAPRRCFVIRKQDSPAGAGEGSCTEPARDAAGSVWRCCLQVDAETRADRTVSAAEGAAERERRTPDALAVADRQAAFAALEAGADGDATAFALGAGGVDRHVEHRRAHRAHAVDAAVLLVQAAVDVVEAVLECGDTAFELAGIEADQLLDRDIGVLVGLVEGVGVAGGHVVADRVFAAVGVGGGLVERVRVTRTGDLGGDAAHLVLGQAVQAAAGRALGALP